jgi:hypothetical protein
MNIACRGVCALAMILIVAIAERSLRAEVAEERLRSGLAKCLSFGEIKVGRDKNGAAILDVGHNLDFSKDGRLERDLEKAGDESNLSYYLHYRWVARAKDKDGNTIERLRGNCSSILPGKSETVSSCSFGKFFEGADGDEVTCTFSLEFHVTEETSVPPGVPQPKPRWITGDRSLSVREVRITRNGKGDKLEYVVHVSDAKDNATSSGSGDNKVRPR